MSGRGKTISAGEKALQRVNLIQKANKGYKMIPTDHPKVFIEAPWNSWTFEQTFTNATALLTNTVSIDTILTQIATKLSLTSIEKVVIKIHAAQAWVTSGTMLVQPNLEARFFELSRGDSQVRSLQRDVGSWNKPAKAGYVYPTVDKSEIYNINDKDRKVVSVVAVAAESKTTVRVQLLWRSYTP